ncbi:hypothetical protein C900_05757 [Fulvivirga imtechensis AK7]|uniref:DUF1232 domain-containing protein n=1 Tax=Fulvivirga imtechensis AK7 TaxID=1237149 RepID=L8K0Y7_9BACT|nr:YkvA family protein [Fulvivirga imtechensis]ELR73122.1 hypothetical protein C900_05757 [Fulvivirga imtechensis AK7]
MENINDNKFFRSARQRAGKILDNRERLLNLLKASGDKIKEIDLTKMRENKFVDRLKVIIRMVKAYKNGEYRGVQIQNILLLVAALLYFVTPIDLIPDFIPITGFVDDFAVVVWVYSRLQEEIDKFILWEKQTAD